MSNSQAGGVNRDASKVRAMFGAIAARYDLLNHLLSAGQDIRWRQRGIALLQPQAGELILDLCCGTGDLALTCRNQQPGCNVVGADFALPMLRLARTKLSAVPLVLGDALQLPFADEKFDALMVAFGVRNFAQTTTGLQEMARVTRRGGRVLVLDFMKPRRWWLRRIFALFFRHILPRVGGYISGQPQAYAYLPASVNDFYTTEQFVALLRRCGWSPVRQVTLSGGIATAFVAQKSPAN